MLAWGRAIRRELLCPHLGLPLRGVVQDSLACPCSGGKLWPGVTLGVQNRARDGGSWGLQSEEGAEANSKSRA